jgi:hypothetical protein
MEARMSKLADIISQQHEYDEMLEKTKKMCPVKIDVEVKRDEGMPVARIVYDPAEKFIRIKAGGSEIFLWPQDLAVLYKAIGQLVVD